MLPLQISNRFARPGEAENAFLNFLRKANAPIEQSKTIATQILSHAKTVGGVVGQIDFFTGVFVQADTNIVGAFVRPASEHFVVYKIVYYEAIFAGTPSQVPAWNNGLGSAGTGGSLHNATISIDTNGIQYLKNMPLTEFQFEVITKEHGALFLDQPIIWQGQETLTLALNNQAGVAYVANEQVKFDFVGIGLIA